MKAVMHLLHMVQIFLIVVGRLKRPLACVRSALSKMDLAHSMSKKDSAKQHLCSQLSLWPLWWPSFGLISS